MAGAGIGNAAGLVTVFDGGNPRIIGGYARSNISGGAFVFASGADNVVSSGLNSFVTGDVLFTTDASGAQFNGICVQSAGSNSPVAVATRGCYILVADGTVTAGYKVKCDGSNSVANIGSTADALANGPSIAIGRALTNAASGGFCIVDIQG